MFANVGKVSLGRKNSAVRHLARTGAKTGSAWLRTSACVTRVSSRVEITVTVRAWNTCPRARRFAKATVSAWKTRNRASVLTGGRGRNATNPPSVFW